MKVKFKPEVEKVLKARFKKDNPNARNKDWVSITTNDSGQSYCRFVNVYYFTNTIICIIIK